MSPVTKSLQNDILKLLKFLSVRYCLIAFGSCVEKTDREHPSPPLGGTDVCVKLLT